MKTKSLATDFLLLAQHMGGKRNWHLHGTCLAFMFNYIAQWSPPNNVHHIYPSPRENHEKLAFTSLS